MKLTVEMGSGAMIYMPSFINIGSGSQKLIGGYTNTQTARRSHKPTFIISKKKSGLIIKEVTIFYITSKMQNITA
jgi:hypothetical protein